MCRTGVGDMSDNLRIDDLSPEQVELLDQMWAIDTTSGLQEFIAQQTPETKKEIDLLIELVNLSYTDSIVDEMEVYPHAEEMLRNILK